MAVGKLVVAALGPLDRERRHRQPVKQQLHRVQVPASQSADVAGTVARQPDLDVVLAVLRERIGGRQAPACPDRQTGDMFFLRRVGRHANDVALQRRLRAAHRQPADLLRRGNVAIEQRRGQVADVDVVEAVARFVGRQQRPGVDVERQQIPDGVLILGAVEAPQRLGAARIRRRRGRLVERRLQPRRQRAAVSGRRLRPRRRRHRAGAQLAHRLFPGFGALVHVGDIEPLQRQTGGFEPIVVAGHAVLIEHRTRARR